MPAAHHEIEQPQDTSLGMLIVRYGLGGGDGPRRRRDARDLARGPEVRRLRHGRRWRALGGDVLFRLGLSSDADREEEERARNHFDAHGEWAEDTPQVGRRWTLPAGIITYEQEQRRAGQPSARETAGVAV